MNIVLDFKSLFYQIRNTSCSYHKSFDQHLDSQSQENDSEADEGEEYHHYKTSNRYHNYDFEKDNKIPYNYDECNSCACQKCDNPPDCCKEVCKSCSKPSERLSDIQMMALSQMPQLSMAISPESPMTLHQMLQMSLGQNSMSEMQMPQMQVAQMQIPQMPMPQMQIPQMQLPEMQVPQLQMPVMQMSRMPSPGRQFSFSDQGLIYFPLSSNLMTFLKNYSLPELTESKAQQIDNISTTDIISATKTVTTISIPTGETQTTTQIAVRATTKEDTEIHKTRLKQIETKNMLEAAIKNALSALSNNVRKTEDKSSSHYNRYVMASALRKTKPVISKIDSLRFGNLPIANNMAESLILETRNAKGIRP
ncbi:unnamed protein product [Arctia plantaginis]|uniref:Uncharacterized protein n=1 Tax=Arctia plantaginis TaxID=874455 RepID=A0A8S1BHI3_ARCPL|nr:unnamed protein product [Arctia plantaginis]